MRYTENCVYAVKVPDGVKIGFTSRLGDRLSSFQKLYGVACYPVALIGGLTRADAKHIETQLHSAFLEKRMSSEVFSITAIEASARFLSVETLAST